MSAATEARLEAVQVLNEIRALGGYVLLLYKENLTDRYLKIMNCYQVPRALRLRFKAQAIEIAKVVIEEAKE